MGSAHLATPGGILMKINWRRREETYTIKLYGLKGYFIFSISMGISNHYLQRCSQYAIQKLNNLEKLLPFAGYIHTKKERGVGWNKNPITWLTTSRVGLACQITTCKGLKRKHPSTPILAIIFSINPC